MINIKSILFVFYICIFFLHSCSSSTVRINAIGLVPIDYELKGWDKDGEIVICNNLAELLRQINGGAPFYIERGAKRIVFQDYKDSNKNVYINLEIYEMEDNNKAEKLFNDVFVDQPISLPGIGKRCRMAGSLIGVYSIDFFKENFYTKLTITDKTNKSKKQLENFARIISNKINNFRPIGE